LPSGTSTYRQKTHYVPLIYRQHDFRTINELWVCFPDAYARVALMFDGRHLKKSKTIIKKGDLNPEFDETFAFDVPSQKLGSIYFRVSILHAGKTKEEHRLLGRVYIGPNLDAEAHTHWMEMIHTPRKQVTSWHKIQG